MSGFGMAVLAPDATPNGRSVWQTDRGYSRADFSPKLRVSGDTFELRLHADEMEFDPDSGYERLVIYRYRVSGGDVTRLEPVAAHARGFVDEWLSMPFTEALDQSDSSQTDVLRSVHKQYETSHAESSDEYTSWHSGPMQACSAKGRFQVEMDTEHNRMVPGKPGGETTPGPTYYFQLQQDNGYRLLAITKKPDPTCTGPDLMQKTSR